MGRASNGRWGSRSSSGYRVGRGENLGAPGARFAGVFYPSLLGFATLSALNYRILWGGLRILDLHIEVRILAPQPLGMIDI